MEKFETASRTVPFIKWAGRQKATNSRNYKTFTWRYYDFFIGGALLSHLQPTKGGINDFNDELVNTYRMIKKCPDDLLAVLSRHEQANSETYFYQVRSQERNQDYQFFLMSNRPHGSSISAAPASTVCTVLTARLFQNAIWKVQKTGHRQRTDRTIPRYGPPRHL